MARKELRLGTSARTLGFGSAVAVAVGVLAVIFGDVMVATGGVLAVIFGVVALLLAVGTYLQS